MFLFFLPGAGRATRWTPPVFAVVALGAVIAALTVPAYTRDAPRHLTIVHEDDTGKAARQRAAATRYRRAGDVRGQARRQGLLARARAEALRRWQHRNPVRYGGG
jgi:hypothetical protein